MAIFIQLVIFIFKTNEFNNSYESLSVFYQAYNSNRIEENRTSGTFYFKANDLYVLPELETLSYSLIAPPRNGKVYEYHFFFTSGATATVITHPEGVLHNLTVEPNKKYEISILENCLSYQCWDLSATTSVSEEEIVDESEVV